MQKKHGWYVGAANNGLKSVLRQRKFKYVLFMNNDMIITDPFWLNKMIKVIEADPKIGAEGCQLIYPTGIIQWAGMSFGKLMLFPQSLHRGEKQSKKLDVIKETCAASGIMLVRTELFRRFGLFDPNFSMGGEETDFCIRIRNNGWRVVYNGKVKVIHLESFTVTEHPNTKIREMSKYLGMVGYVYFLRKNFSLPKQLLGCIIILGKSVFRLNRSEKDRAERSESRRSILSIRFQEKPHKQVYLAIKAIKAAYSLKLNGK
ncbi:MAG: glycosyltransferase, partial [Caldisphaera sp.]